MDANPHLITINFCALISFFFLLIFLDFSTASDFINQNQSITDGKTLVSKGQTFELGFFSPGKSKKRYLGIWFKTISDTVVWVANRDNPLSDTLGELTIDNNSNQLVLLNSSKIIIWSSNSLPQRVPRNPIAQLLDSGNLVLKENYNDTTSSEIYLWQSFDYPTDTLLAGMKLGWDLNTGLERQLTSWRNDDDPSTGDFTYRLDIKGLPQFVCSSGSIKKFRSGIWNGVRFNSFPDLAYTFYEPIVVFNENESYYMFEPYINSVITRLRLNHLGEDKRFILQYGSTEWTIMYTLPYQQCDSYASCGANGICRKSGEPLCDCLKGFIPRSQSEWKELHWSSGCVRKSLLDCGKGEGFVKLAGVKLPDLLEFKLNKSMSLKECKEECLKNCSCTAYANSDIRNGGSGCLMWFGDLVDIRELHIKENDQEMYIRLSASEMKSIQDAKKRKRLEIILGATLTSGISIFFIVLWYMIWKLSRRVRGQSEDEDIELPLFDLATIATATNNFSPACMIGEGGFGFVYKGKLSTGQDIAVKRLSKDSGQGLKEFKNEVELIAKLQHRNLVALLGCCAQGEERMLIYEYMPNKSLDHFIFDSTRIRSLAWKKHLDIIMGIARGLLYLHRDSKLHIIHRDLKASNILLDNNLNPKISDFGLARIFEDDEIESRTKRVVGTYGYMSPEYAIDGKFSVKSDIFSFGVLLLEIVSGKKNRRFSHPDHSHNLLGHAWLLWNEGKALDLMDACLKDSCIESQVLRCIQVGLLCVQKFPQDRPLMSSVVFMLENEEATLPEPKQPGFFTERGSSDECSTSISPKSHTKNIVTITMPNGR